jgi:hypothetical protein
MPRHFLVRFRSKLTKAVPSAKHFPDHSITLIHFFETTELLILRAELRAETKKGHQPPFVKRRRITAIFMLPSTSEINFQQSLPERNSLAGSSRS